MPTLRRSTLFILIEVLVYSFWLNSCITADAPPPRIDPRAAPYLATFLKTAANYGYYPDARQLRIDITDDIDPASLVGPRYVTIGVCHHFPADVFPPWVELSEKHWLLTNTYGREALLYHELGHCLLHEFEHRNDNNDSLGLDIPGSLMNEIIVDAEIYQQFRGYYLTELFSHVADDVPMSWERGASYLPNHHLSE